MTDIRREASPINPPEYFGLEKKNKTEREKITDRWERTRIVSRRRHNARKSIHTSLKIDLSTPQSMDIAL